MRQTLGFGLALLASLPGSLAWAGIVTTSGALVHVPPPADVTMASPSTEGQMLVFDEQQDVLICAPITAQAIMPGFYDEDADLLSVQVPAGMRVRSHYLFSRDTGDTLVEITGSVTFDSDIIAVLSYLPSLTVESNPLGAAGTLYPTNASGQASALGTDLNIMQDNFELSPDHRTITVDLQTGQTGDRLRVLTAAFPDQSVLDAVADAFALPEEAAQPRPELAEYFANLGTDGEPLRNFDQIGLNATLAHTIDLAGLAADGALLEFHVRAHSTGSPQIAGDTLRLQYAGDAAFIYAVTLANLPVSPGGAALGEWAADSEVTFLVDLGNLPPSTDTPGINSLIAQMNADGYLDFVIADDSAVDYVRLILFTSEPCAAIASANPPLVSPFNDMQKFRDVLQTGTSASAVTQGIGAAGTPNQDSLTYGGISVSFDAEPSPPPSLGNVLVTCNGAGAYPCPSANAVSGSGAGPYLISLSGPIPPRNCTTLRFASTSTKLQYQSLPGDVNLNGSVGATDISALVNAINVGSPPPASLAANLPRYNVNRTSGVSATDVSRLVQLLNGVNTTEPWTGATVATCPN